jgi:hypothetical protein
MHNKQAIRDAFDEVCRAISELDQVKKQLANLHYRVEEVEVSGEILNRISHVYEPSNDSHEALFMRKSKADEDLRCFLDKDRREDIERRLSAAYNSTSEAFAKVKKVL